MGRLGTGKNRTKEPFMRRQAVLRLLAATFTIVALLGACDFNPVPDNDRTGEIGREQGDLDRDVEDADDDPRQGPEEAPR